MMRIAGEIHLCHKALTLAVDLKVDMCGANRSRACWVCAGFDGLQCVVALVVSVNDGETIKVRINRCAIVIIRMGIAAKLFACQISIFASRTGSALRLSTRPLRYKS
jgi:hypothetical protein